MLFLEVSGNHRKKLKSNWMKKKKTTTKINKSAIEFTVTKHPVKYCENFVKYKLKRTFIIHITNSCIHSFNIQKMNSLNEQKIDEWKCVWVIAISGNFIHLVTYSRFKPSNLCYAMWAGVKCFKLATLFCVEWCWQIWWTENKW